MDKLILLSQDKATLNALRDYFISVLDEKTIKCVKLGENPAGYREAYEIVKKVLDDVNALYKENKNTNPDSSE